MEEPMADAISRLVDQREIENLLIDYCRYLDRMELGKLAALFSEDCRVIYGPDPKLTARGRPGLEASLSRMWRWRRTAHHLTNIRIRFDGDARADSESYVHAWHEGVDGNTAIIYGRYLDRLHRLDEVWKITERRMDMNGCDNGFKVPVPPAPRCMPPSGWSPPQGLDG
jgi:hypothetical protein